MVRRRARQPAPPGERESTRRLAPHRSMTTPAPAHRRVIHVVHDAHLGGGPIVAERLGTALRGHGWESHYYLPSPGPLTDVLDADGLTWSIVDHRGSVIGATRALHAA